MKKMLLAALTATLLSPVLFGNLAQAMTAAPAVATNTGLVQKAAVVCGPRGCARVWRRRYFDYYGYRPYRYGWYGRRWWW